MCSGNNVVEQPSFTRLPRRGGHGKSVTDERPSRQALAWKWQEHYILLPTFYCSVVQCCLLRASPCSQDSTTSANLLLSERENCAWPELLTCIHKGTTKGRTLMFAFYCFHSNTQVVDACTTPGYCTMQSPCSKAFCGLWILFSQWGQLEEGVRNSLMLPSTAGRSNARLWLIFYKCVPVAISTLKPSTHTTLPAQRYGKLQRQRRLRKIECTRKGRKVSQRRRHFRND